MEFTSGRPARPTSWARRGRCGCAEPAGALAAGLAARVARGHFAWKAKCRGTGRRDSWHPRQFAQLEPRDDGGVAAFRTTIAVDRTGDARGEQRPDDVERPPDNVFGRCLGLMQLMPGTWQEMRLKWGLGSAPHFPPDNIIVGAAYLCEMYGRFGYPGLFAAYDAGPARYKLGSNQDAHYPPRRVITLVRSQGAMNAPKRRLPPRRGADFRYR